MKTGWGVLSVVAIDDLIALKKTRGIYDDEVISNLVQIRVSQSNPPSRDIVEWGFRETSRAEDRVEFARQLGRRITVGQCRRQIAREPYRAQARDVAYWRPILRELQDLRRRGLLLPQGSRIAPIRRSR